MCRFAMESLAVPWVMTEKDAVLGARFFSFFLAGQFFT